MQELLLLLAGFLQSYNTTHVTHFYPRSFKSDLALRASLSQLYSFFYPRVHSPHLLNSFQSWPPVLAMGGAPASCSANALNSPFTTMADPRLCKLCRILLLEPHANSIDLCNLDTAKGTSGPAMEIIKQSAISGCPVCYLVWETFQARLGNALGVAKKDRKFQNVLKTATSALPRVVLESPGLRWNSGPNLIYELKGESSDRVPAKIYHDLQTIFVNLLAPDSESASNINSEMDRCDDANYI